MSVVRELRETDLPLPCARCGYDLRGTQSEVCPECGVAIDRASLHTADIPWERRGKEGRLRSFFATAWRVMFRPGRFAQQATRPIDYAAARRFQVICCLIGAASIGVVLMWGGGGGDGGGGGWGGLGGGGLWLDRKNLLGLTEPPSTPHLYGRLAAPPSMMAIAGDVLIVAGVHVAVFVWLVLITGVPSYFFQPRHLPRTLQDRAVAFSYYASAPLVLMPIVLGLANAAAAGQSHLDHGGPTGVIAYAAIGIVAVFVLLYATLGSTIIAAVLLVRGTHASAGRVLAMIATVLLAWPTLLMLCLLIIPGGIFYCQFLWYLSR